MRKEIIKTDHPDVYEVYIFDKSEEALHDMGVIIRREDPRYVVDFLEEQGDEYSLWLGIQSNEFVTKREFEDEFNDLWRDAKKEYKERRK